MFRGASFHSIILPIILLLLNGKQLEIKTHQIPGLKALNLILPNQ